MNKFVALCLLIIFCVSAVAGEDEYRIGFFWAWKNPNIQPPARLWEQMDSLHCNFGHFGRIKNATQAKRILDSAKKHNIAVQFQWNPIYDVHYFSTRMIYFAGKWNDNRYFFKQNDPQSRTTGDEIPDRTVLRNLPDEIDIQNRTVIHCKPGQHQEGYITQHLVNDPYPENWIYQIRLNDTYHLKTRLRISNTDNIDPSSPIIRIACVESTTRKILAEKIVTLQEFPILKSGNYEEIELLSFQRPYLYQDRKTKKYVANPANPKDFKRAKVTLDFTTYWYGTVETRLDYIKLDSDQAHKLFKGQFDEELINGISQFKDHPSLEYLYLKDEPEYAYFRPGNYINRLLQTNTGASGIVVNNKEMFSEDYTLLNGVKDYVFDLYPIRGYLIPVPPPYNENRQRTIDKKLGPAYTTESAYNDSLQKAFNDLLLKALIPGREAANKYNINLWYCPQTFSQRLRDEKRFRYRCPTPEELEASVYLALAYGVKGLFYFQYMNMSTDNFYFGGVVNDKLQHIETIGRTKWGENLYIGNDLLWDTLLRLNPNAEKILKVTQHLKAITQFDEHTLEPPIQEITNWNRRLSGNIHFGTFRDDQNELYFMIVNKQCHPNAGQQFTLNLILQPNRKCVVQDLLRESNFVINTDSFGKAEHDITIGAGKGQLYKLLLVD